MNREFKRWGGVPAWLDASIRQSLARSIARSRAVQLVYAVGAVLSLGFIVFSPLTGLPGAESALVLGIVLPPFVAAASARLGIAARAQGVERAFELVERATTLGLSSVALPLTLLSLNGLRVSWCAPLEGLMFVLLGPGLGCLFAAYIGVAWAVSVGPSRVATGFAAATPIVALLARASTLYTTPAVFGYGHFFGYYPGTLYDLDLSIGAPYLTFRAITVVLLGGLVAFVAGTVDPVSVRFSLRHARRHLGNLSLGLCALVLVIAAEYGATSLGHQSTSDSIRERLGTTLRGRYCDVVVPRETPLRQAERIRDDCDFRVFQAGEALELDDPHRITAFFFRSPEEKRALMGASTTYVAKPWRHEVYLNIGEWPHPVLAHEIVHAVAAPIGTGPFAISGHLFGLLPSPGIIEGLAMAIAWESREGLTTHQWARAMIELGLAPSVAETEGLGFLLQPASRAYVLSGSFVRWIYETRGAAAVRAVYRNGDYASALGIPTDEAERQWRAWLETEVALPEAARALAEARFERPAVFARVCPHQVAFLMDAVAADLGSGNEEGAIRGCSRVMEIDPSDTRARAWLAIALARAGQNDEAYEELARLIGPPAAARPIIDAARRGIADALWAQGKREDAAIIYRQILEEPLNDDDARQLDVRLLGTTGSPESSRHLREVIAPSSDQIHDPATAMQAIWRLSETRTDGLGPYLEARQMMSRLRFGRAKIALDEALSRGLEGPRLVTEARRMNAVIAFATNDLERARELWNQVLRDPQVSDAERVEAADWLARIRWQRGLDESRSITAESSMQWQ